MDGLMEQTVVTMCSLGCSTVVAVVWMVSWNTDGSMCSLDGSTVVAEDRWPHGIQAVF